MFNLSHMNIEISGVCNCKCKMCPQSQPNGRDKDFLKLMPYEIFEKVVLDAIKHGITTISLTGSGEPTLHPDLVKMVQFASSRGLHSCFYTNATKLTPELFERLVIAGLNLLTISIIGHTKEKYEEWMNGNNFEKVFANLKGCFELKEKKTLAITTRMHHLIIDPAKSDEEVAEYKKNWIEPLKCESEIWLMHNWSGVSSYKNYDRRNLSPALPEKRSCGRPLSLALEVRAGGPDGHFASVVPCPFVLGRDADAVMGYLDSNTIEEVLSGEKFQKIRELHRRLKFDEINFCKDCDQLYCMPSSLVWTNIAGRIYGQSKVSNVVYSK